ncbi:hydantoinase B/oxoprolinase family protein [Nocardioides taihuensis]|uniref:Hydantoinase B/oxoprolinase family protein n=1 Tax=Nocardioides taihuensis TaxID=1835606 RepID=A0ABW0BQ97_9ACTN
MTTPDPATLEIIRNRLLAAAEDMRVTLVRSAYTPTIYESEDCAIGLLDRNAEVIALSTGLPIFLGNLGQAVVESVKVRGGAQAMRPGDVYLLNDAYLQGAHMQDCTSFAPIFFGDDLIGYAVARAHMVDLGSSEPGGGMAATSIFDEGLRLGPVRIFEGDRPCDDIFDVLRHNTRSQDELVGDVLAMAAAVRAGASRLTEIVERWGMEVFDAACAAIFEYSEQETRAAIRAVPDGTYTATGAMDDDGIDVGVPVVINVSVTVAGDQVSVDLAGTGPMVRGAINCGVAQTVSSVRVALRLLLGGTRPPDGGTFRPVSVSVPRGSFLYAEEPAACGNYAASAVLLMDLVMRALADAVPDRACAGQYGDTISELVWTDAAGKHLMLGEAHAGGWGAGEGYTGADATIDLTNGQFRNFSVELLESRYPVVVEEYGYREGSAGAGRFRGGRGIVRRYRLEEPALFYLWMDRVHTPPWGLHGGHDGATAFARLRTADGVEDVLKCEGRQLSAGDEVTIYTAGGGGYGTPVDAEGGDGSVPREVATTGRAR